MSVERWQRLEALYHEALTRPPGERACFLEQACAGNETLRRELEQLLAWDARAGTFLDAPIFSTSGETSSAEGAAHDPELAPGHLFGNFQIVRHLGQGGMGRVYEAVDLALQRRVALKLLSDSSSEGGTARERVLHEARAASALAHPHIVTVYAVQHAEGRDFIVMEYVQGETLRQALALGPLPIGRMLSLAASITGALAVAHARGVVHRDVKPDNIMLTTTGEPKLLDFGVARQDRRSDDSPAPASYDARAWGTVNYMSPEQIRRECLDDRSDQFSLGVILFEMLAGFRPFDRGSAAETLTAILRADPPPLATLGIDCPPPLQWTIERCLAKDAADRFPTTARLYDEVVAIRDGLNVDGIGAVAPSLTKPPLARTSLIGRNEDLVGLTRLVTDERVRLITLTGPGGVGKTRLAVHVAIELDGNFGGLVGFVDLSAITDAQLVAAVIAQVLDVRNTGGRPMREAVSRWMRERNGMAMLLVVDNFEQVLDAGPILTSLLDANQQLRIIVTSRTVLRVHGEREYPVDPLKLPDPGTSFDTLAENPAVALFVERAMAVRPDFALTPGNAQEVAAICSKLDGLPMAIELAAARVKSLSTTEILNRFRSRLQLVTGGGRDLPARRQTLRSAIDWSYELLDADEQIVFCRMSVFVGGATLEALEAACNPFEDLTRTIVDVIGSLIDKSMVVRLEAVQGETRFTMLETLREYAAMRLTDRGEEDITRRAHAAYCLVLAEECPHYQSQQQLDDWRQRCDVELDNLRVGMQWMVEQQELEWAIRLNIALEPYWFVRGWTDWVWDLRSRVYQLPWRAPSLSSWRVVGFLAGNSRLFDSRGDSAPARHTTSPPVEPGAGPAQQATVLIGLGARALYNGGLANARKCLDEALEMSRRIGSDLLTGGALSSLATLHKLEGDCNRARQLYAESRELFARVGDDGAVAWSYNFEADAARRDGDIAAAEALLETALQKFRALEDTWGIGSCLADLGRLASDRRDFALAEARYRGGLRMFDSVRHRGGIRQILEGLAMTAAARQEGGRALRLAGAAAAMWREYRDDGRRHQHTRPELDRALVRIRTEEGEPAAAAWLEGWNHSIDTIAFALALDASTPVDHVGADSVGDRPRQAGFENGRWSREKG
jgi:predicted ATPase